MIYDPLNDPKEPIADRASSDNKLYTDEPKPWLETDWERNYELPISTTHPDPYPVEPPMTNPVSEPLTESDMSAFRTIFEKIANVIVENSKLSKEAESLRTEVSDMKARYADYTDLVQAKGEAERLREECAGLRQQRNLFQDDANKFKSELIEAKASLEYFREERDQMVRSNETLESERQSLLNVRNSLQSENSDLRNQIADLEDRLKTAKADYEGEAYRNIELHDQNKNLEERNKVLYNDNQRITSERDTLAKRLDQIQSVFTNKADYSASF